MGRISRSLVVTLGLCVVLVAALALGVLLLTGPARSTAPAQVAPRTEVAAGPAGGSASAAAVDPSDDPSAWLDAPVPTTTEGPRAHPPTEAASRAAQPRVSTQARPRRTGAGGVRAPVGGRPDPAPTRSDPAVPVVPSPRTSSSPRPTIRPTPSPKPTASPRPTTSPKPAPSPTCRPRGQAQDPQHPLPRCPKG